MDSDCTIRAVDSVLEAVTSVVVSGEDDCPVEDPIEEVELAWVVEEEPMEELELAWLAVVGEDVEFCVEFEPVDAGSLEVVVIS